MTQPLDVPPDVPRAVTAAGRLHAVPAGATAPLTRPAHPPDRSERTPDLAAPAAGPATRAPSSEWASAFDVLPQLVCLLDRNGHLLHANATLERWRLGSSREANGRSLHHLLHPACRKPGCELELACLLGQGQLWNGLPWTTELRDERLGRWLRVEMRALPADGAAAVLATVSDVSDARDRVPGNAEGQEALRLRIASLAAELARSNEQLRDQASERERLERALRAGEQKYRLLAGTMSDGLAQHDDDGRLREVNDALCRMLGYRREELLGQFLPELLTEPYGTQLRACLAAGRYSAGGRCEAEWRCPGGRRIYTRMALQPVAAEGDVPGGYCTIVTDITERRQTERALRRSKCELKLLSAQLLAAQEMERKRIALELHDRVGQSLSAIKFRVESAVALLEGRLDPADLAGFQTAVERLQTVVEDVRRIAMDLRPSTLDDLGILPTIAWFCREFRDVYRHIELDVDIAVAEQEVPVGRGPRSTGCCRRR